MLSQELTICMAVTGLSDQDAGDLLRRARSGDLAAFEGIMLRHERQVYRTALRILGVREDAQDAAQEVFLRLYRFLHKFDEARELGPWLYRITVNVCRDLHAKRRPSVVLDEVDTAEQGPSPEAQSAAREERSIIEQAIRELPERERAALVLRDVEGLSTREVADILGSSENTVRSQVCMARTKLKKFRDRLLGNRRAGR